ncbi:phosphohydrolase [Vibrio splendidus]|nr:phosphohydrolase [Vibrio splendidus]
MTKFKRIPLRVILGAMFVFCTIVTASVVITVQYQFAKQAELQHVLNRYHSIAIGVSSNLSNLQNLAGNVTQTGAQMVALIDEDLTHKNIVVSLSKLVTKEPSLYSVFIAKENNDFYQLINLSDDSIRSRLGAKERDAWLLVVHQGDKRERRKRSIYYDKNFSVRSEVQGYSSFYPIQRSWYQNARNNEVYNTQPYLFHSIQLSGETFTTTVPGSDTVVGVDVLLSSIETQLTNRFITNNKQPEAEAFVYRANGRLIATNKNVDINEQIPFVTPLALTDKQREVVANTPELRVSNQNDWGPLDHAIAGRPAGYAIDLFKMISQMTGLQFKFINGRSWSELVRDFHNGNIDILHSLVDLDEFTPKGSVGGALYNAEFALLTLEKNNDINTLKQVLNERIGLIKGWSIQDDLYRAYPNMTIINYSSLHDAIDGVVSGEIIAVLDVKQVLRSKVQESFRQSLTINGVEDKLLANNFHYVMPEEMAPLVEIIDQAVDAITEEQLRELGNKWNQEGVAHSRYTFTPYPELVDYAKDPEFIDAVRLISLNGEEKYVYVSKLSYKDRRFFAVVVPKSYVMSGVYESTLLAAGTSLLVVVILLPVAWLFALPISNPIKSLRSQVKLIKQRDYDQVQRVHSRIEEIHQLGLSVIRGSHSFKEFEQRQNEFFDSMIQLIARAIDEKSHYTAGHCNRVPEIALMLAEAAEKSNKGGLDSFKFDNDEERREFRIAAWLHDCGKIATPEYVVDKGSKLETNYNRIHEVRMRFEVLWRDAQIEYLKDRLHELGVDEQSEQALRKEFDQLTEQFEFIANANVGGEFMSQQDIERLHELAQKEWTRYFDSGLGLSPLEDSRYHTKPTPNKEQLLSDQPEHVVKREQPFEVDPAFGINMQVPDVLYNHGELYNLSVQRGTLSAEERFKINEHMISGIKMLESIPFPPELKRVPRYATTHHETMEGTGYPRGLKGEELSIPERILVVADIFEALTAADRPYKKAKSLDEAINILFKMALGGHIDKEVFALLLTSDVYVSYAKKYLPDELIDQVDVERYLTQLKSEFKARG